MKNEIDIQMGDLVKLRSDLEHYKRYGGVTFVPDMSFDNYGLVNSIEYNGTFHILGINYYAYAKEMISEVKRPCQYKIIYKEKSKKPILDEKEKEYLSAVIKPFRNDVASIKKLSCNDKKEYLKIDFKDIDYINFRNFKKGTMYKGMEIGIDYTLEELGL